MSKEVGSKAALERENMSPGENRTVDSNPLFLFLESIRTVLIQSGIVVFLFSIAGYFISPTIMEFLRVRTGVTLAAFAIPETFLALLTASLATGLIAGVPFVFYRVLRQLGIFFPSLSRRMMLAFWVASLFLFICGAVFCFSVTLPYGIRFLLSFEDPRVEAVISVKRFISFCFLFIIGFGIIFELPLVMILIGRLGVVDAKTLATYRRYAILVITVISAILTPTPDIFNLALMAVPLYLLYEIGLIAMRISRKYK